MSSDQREIPDPEGSRGLLLEDTLGGALFVLEGVKWARNIIGGEGCEWEGQSLGAGSGHQVTAY